MRANERIQFANTLRGIAIILVLIAHYCSVFWFARDAVSTLTNMPVLSLEKNPIPCYLLPLNWISTFNIGAYGVALFFLISGFVIPFSIQKNSILSFMIQRFFRIIPVYIIGFSITLLAIWVGGTYFGRDFPFSFQEIFIHLFPGARDILWSRNIDGVIWTLEIEVKFYLICALSSHWIKNNSRKIFLIPLFMTIISMILSNKIDQWSASSILLYRQSFNFTFLTIFVSFMFIGVVFNFLQTDKIEPKQAFPLIIALEIMSLLVCSFSPHKIFLPLAWSYGLAIFTFSFAYANPHIFDSKRITNFFADISYPLYVIHGALGYVLLHILLVLNVADWLALILVITTSVTLSYLLHLLVEKPLQKLGKKISRRFNSF
jgi:peptidoglycan/LPS O-acetylase OafA/YrhL